jgi:ribbon-helix-helix CopG family protein
MKTVSYSLDEDIVEGIAEMAALARISKSDVVRAMYLRLQLKRTLDTMREEYAPRLAELGLETEDDIAAYAKSK